jgi:hypothetical protein
MRQGIRISIAISAVMIVALAMPAGATHPTGTAHPTFRTENAFFLCTGKVQNVSATGPTGWDTTAPSQSATAGAGCIATDPNLVAAAGTAQENLYDAVFSGFYTGNLRDLTVKLHSIVTSQVRSGGNVALRVRLAIDGEALFTTTTNALIANVTPVPGSNAAVQRLEFSITNLGFAKYLRDAAGNLTDVQTGGLGKEDGDGTMEHQIVVSVDTTGAGDQGLWAMGATEAPSGITFNPATLASAKIKSPLPQGV